VSSARVEAGMLRQLELRRRMLDGGARPLGWKVGLNAQPVQEKLGIDGPVVGFLTSATRIEAGGEFTLPTGAETVSIEPEVGVEIAADGSSIASCMPALEVVLFDRPLDQLEDVLAYDVFHRGVILGPLGQGTALGAARVFVNGEQRHALDPDAGVVADAVRSVIRRLEDAGEQLRPGEVIITGTLVAPIEVRAGDRVRLELDPFGAVEVAVSA
jgi:2-keto-4-pentenoate hydratase